MHNPGRMYKKGTENDTRGKKNLFLCVYSFSLRLSTMASLFPHIDGKTVTKEKLLLIKYQNVLNCIAIYKTGLRLILLFACSWVL